MKTCESVSLFVVTLTGFLLLEVFFVAYWYRECRYLYEVSMLLYNKYKIPMLLLEREKNKNKGKEKERIQLIEIGWTTERQNKQSLRIDGKKRIEVNLKSFIFWFLSFDFKLFMYDSFSRWSAMQKRILIECK